MCYGEVAQLARASGSYPAGREFESPLRYHSERGFLIVGNPLLFSYFIKVKKIILVKLG